LASANDVTNISGGGAVCNGDVKKRNMAVVAWRATMTEDGNNEGNVS